MGKIIQNGIEYSGTYSNATSINYDSSASGLNAKTVQEAVDELVENSEAKIYIDNTTETTAFKVWRKDGVVYITCEGVATANTASSGNIAAFSNPDLMPKHTSYFAVSGGNMVGISTSGALSLYTSDLTKFTTGTIFGSFSYLAK